MLDMLVRDDTNPRSLAFQAKGLAEYIAKLEAQPRPLRQRRRWRRRMRRLRALQPADLDPESELLTQTLEQLQRAALRGVRRASR